MIHWVQYLSVAYSFFQYEQFNLVYCLFLFATLDIQYQDEVIEIFNSLSQALALRHLHQQAPEFACLARGSNPLSAGSPEDLFHGPFTGTNY